LFLCKKESEESKDEEGLSEEELKKTEGLKLYYALLDKKMSATS
jgi:hypothetical protein